MFAVFAVMRQLHELLWHLEGGTSGLCLALSLPTSAGLSSDLESAVRDTVAVTGQDAATLASYDVETHRRRSTRCFVRRVGLPDRLLPGRTSTART